MVDFLNNVLFGIGIILLIYGVYWFVHWVMRQRSAKMMENHELQEQIRRVQVIDVREPAEFNVSHILGARNLPSTQMKMRFNEIRKDQPVVLYGESIYPVSRSANFLRKEGYDKVHILKGGLKQWLGKTKSSL